ncbi:MAG: DNA-directed RNA polymerase subunit beta' [Saccharofermentans sp.]|nr:DNA-directed RNA polymerase subunit beta' [Saccharofermentans sp.]
MSDTNHLTKISIQLASPEVIKSWSHGEVKKPETINYRTQRPEVDGLFCEKIFGPTRNWECRCGKYKKIRFKGMICDKCGVEVTKNTVRRERLGHIQLACPVSHIWYFKTQPSKIGTLLDLTVKQLESVLYYSKYIVIDPGVPEETGLNKMDIITEDKYKEVRAKCGRNSFDARMGAEAIKILLSEVNVDKIIEELSAEKSGSVSTQKRLKIDKRLEIAEAFKASGNKPEWMILDVIPVLPPELRPMVPLDGGRYATSDLNDLYRRVIGRNNRLKKLLDLGAPEIIVRNEKRMVQEAVDALIDNGRHGTPVKGSTSATSNRQLKSLSDMLKGKQGRFRQNLLGKRVDYSGRSVIIVGPELKMHQCGLPKEMALELFKPFVIKRLVELNDKLNIKTARKQVDARVADVWDILEEVIQDHPVLLNRAPTLHRLSIQAFEPVLVDGRAIKLHPLVCTGFNADFDGDQMAVHVPLSAEAQAEARFLMLSTNNLLKPQDGKPVTVPTQDMILGCYYLTTEIQGDKGEGMVFTSVDEAMMAYHENQLTLHAMIKVRVTREVNGKEETGLVESTLGRFIFNSIVPQDLGFVDRSKPENHLRLEIDFPKLADQRKKAEEIKKKDPSKDVKLEFAMGKKKLEKIIARCIAVHGLERTTVFLDDVKAMGYKYSTISGISIGIEDMIIPDIKDKMIAQGDALVDEINQASAEGFYSEKERHNEVVKVWADTTNNITQALMDNLDIYNPIRMMADSGARGSNNQIKQLAGMRGLMQDTTGATIEIPIKSNLREGMNVLEFFISSHGARKALSDTALKTAESGYLTRRLVDVAQSVVVTEEDCGTDDFTWVKEITEVSNNSKNVIKSLYDRLYGRYAAEDIKSYQTGEIIVKKNELIDALKAEAISDSVDQAKEEARQARDAIAETVKIKGEVTPEKLAEQSDKIAAKLSDAEASGKVLTEQQIDDLGKIKIRSVFDCRSKRGVCSKCYGINLATGRSVSVGEAVGIIAAQSIGEPGTQLTMRTFHSGGIAGSGEDITQGLPRVTEIFEARDPKGHGIISSVPGTVKINVNSKTKQKTIVVTPTYDADTEPILDAKGNPIERMEYKVPSHATITVKNGEVIEAGDQIIDGKIDPKEILKVKDIRAVQKYIISEVTKVYYTGGGVNINDKHIEIIAKQMMRRVKIDDPGDTDFMTGTTVDLYDYISENSKCEEAGKKPAEGRTILLGIAKAASASDSFMSAASFQETAKVLTDAVIKGKVDPLLGIKENVIIGSLIPAGTGISAHNDITAVPVIKENAELITGHQYGAESDDSALFENPYLEDIKKKNAILDEQAKEQAIKDAEREKDKK